MFASFILELGFEHGSSAADSICTDINTWGGKQDEGESHT
jgi:hypothetical protein